MPGTGEKRGPRRLGRAVEIVLYRVDAGAVEVALFRQDRVGPFAAAADREGRSAIAADRHAAEVFENPLAAPHVVAKFFGRLAICALMAGAVASQLVPCRRRCDAPAADAAPPPIPG